MLRPVCGLVNVMGTGASQQSPSTSPEPPSKTNRIANGNLTMSNSKITDPNADAAQRTLVRTNQVAPIIIKNCKEEYQHVTNFKGPLVYGRIAEGMPEHILIQSQYFLVKDVDPVVDKLGTMDGYLAPNVRRAWGGYPVYGLGQPTKDGLANLMQGIKEEKYNDILLFNLRAEPVLFVKKGYDMVPYSPRHQDRLHECVSFQKQQNTDDISNAEVQLRKEVLDLASIKEDCTFYFYDDIKGFKDDPHILKIAYEDELAVTDEIYSRLSFNNSRIRYIRLMIPPEGAPHEIEVDAFIDVFRRLPHYFDGRDSCIPALVFTAHSGMSRATLGMVMGCLMLAQKKGFPKEASKQPYQINKNSPNYERGEFMAVQKLVEFLPNGLITKQEVDVIIDSCDELHNVRATAAESKKYLESISDDYVIEDNITKNFLVKQCRKHLERYIFLIIFNSYLREQYSVLFSETFTQWMQRRSELYQLYRHLDISERLTEANVLTKGHRFLVADDYIGLDVLSTQMDVKTSNFRRVPGMPVYGMAQPSREGLMEVVTHLLSKKQGHPVVVLINLREDVVLECNGATYSWREADKLEEPIIMPGISASDIEEKEEQLKKEVKNKKTFKVYEESDRPPETREFNSVLTPLEMVNQLRLQIPQVIYHRLPMSDDKSPTEQDFEALMYMVMSLEELHKDEDGPAIIYHCRTGKGRSTTAMAIAGLIVSHNKGFPYGTKPGEEERVSLPNADYTKGNFQVVQMLLRRIPNGQQVKREVDFILDQCSDTMTPMHYHIREVIFVTYNKIKKAKSEEAKTAYRLRSLDYLERYIYLILFNTYLHCERRNKWQTLFSDWMKNVAAKVGVYDILDNLSFSELESNASSWSRRERWEYSHNTPYHRGTFV